jgi:hypothetical protein
MEQRHFAACRAGDHFSDRADYFVGTPAQLAAVFTPAALHAAMAAAYEGAGDATDDAPFAPPGELQRMHVLRNEALFALGDTARRRAMCGRPMQHDDRITPPK